MAQTKNSAVLKSNKLFSGVYDINFNFKDKNYVDVKEGEVIYSRGDKSEYMYLLVNGRVKFKTYENPRQPKVFLVSKNDFFGEKELVDKAARNSSAVAEKDSTLFRLSHKDFVKISGSHKRVLENLKEQKYEEVVAPSRRTELKEDIFKRIINEQEVPAKKDTGIELRDYSYENPLLELKARDEINEELKIYSDDDGPGSDSNILIDDDGVTWEFDKPDKDEDPEIIESLKAELPDFKEPEAAEVIDEPGENVPEVPVNGNDENIADHFYRIQEQVNEFRESLEQQESNSEFEEPEPVEPFKINNLFIDESFVSAVEKISSGLERDETNKLIVQACTELVNAERGIVYFPDLNNVLKGKLVEEDSELVAGAETIPGRCLREMRSINIKDVFNDPDFNPSLDYVSYFHIHSLYCMPLVSDYKVKAVLQLFNSRNGEFSESDEHLLKNISPIMLKSIERYERFEKASELKDKQAAEKIEEALSRIAIDTEDSAEEIDLAEEEEAEKLSSITPVEEIQAIQEEDSNEKKVSLRVLAEFLLQEFQPAIKDIKQFNSYLQRIDIPGETKEISDIVTSQSIKIIDLLEALKGYSESRKIISEEKQSYFQAFENIVNLLAEYTEGRKVNLYKRFESDADIMADSKYLYLAVFQIIKYQCDLMPFGGNIFISSVVSESSVEILIRNTTKKTDETLVIPATPQYDEKTSSGLGLSLARRIMEDHNAFLEVRNQSGTGLEVAIRFPSA